MVKDCIDPEVLLSKMDTNSNNYPSQFDSIGIIEFVFMIIFSLLFIGAMFVMAAESSKIVRISLLFFGLLAALPTIIALRKKYLVYDDKLEIRHIFGIKQIKFREISSLKFREPVRMGRRRRKPP